MSTYPRSFSFVGIIKKDFEPISYLNTRTLAHVIVLGLPLWYRLCTLVGIEFDSHTLVLLASVHAASGGGGALNAAQRDDAVWTGMVDADDLKIMDMIKIFTNRLVCHILLAITNHQVACGTTRSSMGKVWR